MRLTAVGDIMMHNTQITAGYRAETADYNFDAFFAPVQEWLSAADLTVGNLETTLAGKEKRYTGYPMFNSPDAIAEALKTAGFDLLTTANNHSLDRSEFGVIRTLEVLDGLGLAHTGTARSAEERDSILMQEVKGIKLAFLAYTYGTNGIPIPSGKPYLVNLLEPEQMEADAARAREAGADLVIVFLHFGAEYVNAPSREQRDLAEQLIGAGVDIVLGSHPHVLLPLEKTTVTLPDGTEREGWVIYSLGNFISGQNGLRKETGAMVSFQIHKDFGTGRTEVTKVSYVPTWVHRYTENSKTRFRVLAIEPAIAAYESGEDSLISQTAYLSLRKALAQAQNDLGEGIEHPGSVLSD